MDVIYGIHAVAEALKARGRGFEYVAVARERHDVRVQKIVDECRASGIAVRFLPREDLNRLAKSAAHQGVVAVTSVKKYSTLKDVLANKRGAHSLLLVLDGVEDPHNLGAIIRTADAAGVDGIVIPERRAAGITPAVARVSAGASEHLYIAKVTNIARKLEELKQQNIWTVGLESANAGGGGGAPYDSLDYKMDCALVLGAEGKGLHDLVSKRCDFLVFIPMLGKVSSLNVSVAAGIVMYEVVRQRRQAAEKRKK